MIEAIIGEVAGRQHGVVARRQPLKLGLSRRELERRVSRGLLIPTHRGVYAVGHPGLTREGRWMAAVLAGGPHSALSHVSAGMNWRAVDPFASVPSITTPTKGRRRPGIECHSARLAPDEITVHNGIPTTTAARTLLDLAAVLPAHRLERALAQAEYLGLADATPLSTLLERHRGARGTKTLRGLLASSAPISGITRSSLEDRFLVFLNERRLPRPELNRPLRLGTEFIEVDCLWRAARVALELDGRSSHERRTQFEADRRRDRRLLAEGWRPLRVAGQQLDRRSKADELEGDLRRLLDAR